MLESLEILYHEDDIIAINKPHGLLVHPTKIAMDADTSVMQILRDQLGQLVYPVHRLDRKTSGVLLMALTKEKQSILNSFFQNRKMTKHYIAIVRGYVDADGEIDYAIKNEKGVVKEARTIYKLNRHFEIELPFGQFKTSRYSEVDLFPETGRYHQLRMHMAHIFHPIIGDRPHGCNKQNRLFKEKFDLHCMMLHAQDISFELGDRRIEISAKSSLEYKRIKKMLTEGHKKRDIVLK